MRGTGEGGREEERKTEEREQEGYKWSKEVDQQVNQSLEKFKEEKRQGG